MADIVLHSPYRRPMLRLQQNYAGTATTSFTTLHEDLLTPSPSGSVVYSEAGNKERYASVSSQSQRTLPTVTMKLLLKRAKEHSITLKSLQEELTTQQTADVMGVSHSYVVNLLDVGKMPFHPVGTQRYVRFQDLLKYIEDYQREANAALDGMTAEAQGWGLYE